MRNLIEQQLYNPSVILLMVALIELMVLLDFNFGQISAVVATRGAQAALHRSRDFFYSHYGN